jgi:hypothetical protein
MGKGSIRRLVDLKEPVGPYWDLALLDPWWREPGHPQHHPGISIHVVGSGPKVAEKRGRGDFD